MPLKIIGPIKTSNGQVVSFIPLPKTDKRSMYAAYRFHSDPFGEMTLMWKEDNLAYSCRKESDVWVSRMPFTNYVFERYQRNSPEFKALEALLEDANAERALSN